MGVCSVAWRKQAFKKESFRGVWFMGDLQSVLERL
jgi:hypothetical protein